MHGGRARFRVGARAREVEQGKLREREHLAREPHDTVATAEHFADFPPAHAAQQTAHGGQTNSAAFVGRRLHRGLDLFDPRIVRIGSDFNLP